MDKKAFAPIIVVKWPSVSRPLLTPATAIIIKVIFVLVVVVIIIYLGSSATVRPSQWSVGRSLSYSRDRQIRICISCVPWRNWSWGCWLIFLRCLCCNIAVWWWEKTKRGCLRSIAGTRGTAWRGSFVQISVDQRNEAVSSRRRFFGRCFVQIVISKQQKSNNNL